MPALGRYARIDNRTKPSSSPSSWGSYCSTVTLVIFVGLCLVGVWMMTSSSVVPVVVQTSNNLDSMSSSSQEDAKSDNEVKTQVVNESINETVTSTQVVNESINETATSTDQFNNENVDGGNKVIDNDNQSNSTKQFEDNPGILPEDATKGDTSTGGNVSTSSSTVSQGEENRTNNSNPSTDHVKEETNNGEDNESSRAAGVDIQRKKEEGEHNNKTTTVSDRQANDLGGGKNKSTVSSSNSDDAVRKPDELVAGETKESPHEEINKIPQAVDKKADVVLESNQQEKDTSSSSSSIPGSGVIEKNNEEDGNKSKLDFDRANLNNEALFPSGAAELLHETTMHNASSFLTQAAQSKNAKEVHKEHEIAKGYKWKLCNVSTGSDYIPCLDNLVAIKSLKSTKHYEHRERHCPEEPPTCLVPLPKGYQHSIEWPKSREKIWYHNVPHTKLAEVKGHQNWVKVSGEYLTFPGGGTQFKHGALHYIDFIQQLVPDIVWGRRSRVVLDVGCGVASFGGFLFDRDVLTMSFAPKDEHEAQVQFALERGIPAISAVMGTLRLPYPDRVFDVVHCARCRVPWHIEGGKLLLELNRLLRPGGYFVWSATPIYQKGPEDVEIWDAMKKLTKSMCWEVVSIGKDKVNNVGLAIYRKPSTNECYEERPENDPPICKESDDPNAAWGIPLHSCMHKVPISEIERGSKWPLPWPLRLEKPPNWLLSTQVGVYGKPAPEDFTNDYEHWKRVVTKSYINGLGINWSSVRNAMDMRAVYGGFAAALKDMNVWVMNVVSIDAPDTLPIIYERGLFGIYHNWCESFSTYPRSYDLLHADHIFSRIKTTCNLEALVVEVDRILRPGGTLIVRDIIEIINELQAMLQSLHWEVHFTYSKDTEGLLCVHKTMWRPKEFETIN